VAIRAPGRRLSGLTEAEALEVVLACVRAELDGSGALRDLLAKGHGRLTVDVLVRDGCVAGVDTGYSTSERYPLVRGFSPEPRR
jgi:hypothetical protein